ncbi:MAG: 3-keto-5-aminohexanoate cleavage protein [Halieaceae bacterium]|nr:3-keto-5-aminohexanoate cleavage protein [Halieaceae bacterium]
MSLTLAESPLIIEASLNGSASKELNPAVPCSDDETVAAAIACMEAGGAGSQSRPADFSRAVRGLTPHRRGRSVCPPSMARGTAGQARAPSGSPVVRISRKVVAA